ncbi:MAG: DUF4276 family protein [Veillonellaceae bacterium]|nr:DUF4276 family protein [Veillonellaceae bacterium]
MARLYLFAEGQTEQTFANSVLSPHLAKHGVCLHKPVLIAHARKKGKVHRGGGRKYVPMKNDILRFTAQEKGGDVFFTTMIDLYALPNDFPAREEAEELRHDPYRRVGRLEQAWSDDIGDRRFIPFIQLHEYEAYLFTKPGEFDLFYPNSQKQIAKLQEIADSVQSPELIDDGRSTAPSKRINDVFPDYERAKTTIGPQVGESIGIQVIRSKCPHFDGWLTALEQLGQHG